MRGIWHITHQHLISARSVFLVLLEHQTENHETGKKAAEQHCLVSLLFCSLTQPCPFEHPFLHTLWLSDCSYIPTLVDSSSHLSKHIPCNLFFYCFGSNAGFRRFSPHSVSLSLSDSFYPSYFISYYVRLLDSARSCFCFGPVYSCTYT